MKYIHEEVLRQLYGKYKANELSKMTGVSRKTIYNYIKTGNATVDTVSKLCDHLILKIENNG